MAGSILVTTATGTVGQALAAELAAAGEHVRAGSRNPAAIAAQAPASATQQASTVEPVRFDFRDPETFAPALAGVDRVFLLSPAGEADPVELVLPFLEAATRGGQRKIVLMTAFGVEFSDEIPLRKLELFVERSGAPYVFLRPNWFMDNFHTYWLAPIRQGGVIPLPAADSRTAFIDARDIAAAAAGALRSDRFNGQAVTLTGAEPLTYAEAAAILSAAAGREIRYVPVDEATFKQSVLDAGFDAQYADLMAQLFGVVRSGAAAHVDSGVEQLTGRAPTSLAQYARDHAARWQA